ncbi:MAG: hypothetical protein ACM3ML_11640 [Micromonosporaceae bacterium]
MRTDTCGSRIAAWAMTPRVARNARGPVRATHSSAPLSRSTLPPGRNVVPWHVRPTRWVFYSYDVATQAMRGNYYEVTSGRGEYTSIPFRYVRPAELDLMARLAGVAARALGRVDAGTLHERKPQHVSIWEKPAS